MESKVQDQVKENVTTTTKKSKKERKSNEPEQQNSLKKPDVNNPDAPVKSKAELKAERRAVQEAQRAAKAATKGQPQSGGGKPKNQKPVGSKKVEHTASKPKNIPSKTSDGTSTIHKVTDNVQMDNEKVQKKISKKLAKQQVPQRSTAQKKVNLFSHLHQYEKDPSLTKDISFSSGTIHPAIIKLGLQYAEGIITGSNARCITLLCALKQVIIDYETPPSKELSRDLESKIRPCISFLSQCRHLSVSMGNAIKFLKLQITQIKPGVPENEAKNELVDSIDNFIRERIILAGVQISNFAAEKIQEKDIILTYGFSSLVVKILIDAKEEKDKNFEVVVVDSRPDFAGKETVNRLSKHGIKCSYCLVNAVSYAMKDVTTVLLGAHALLANGNVMSRAGSAMVSMVAKSNNVPVLICCETYKFCERVQTDSFVFNELGDPDALVSLNKPNQPDILEGWRDIDCLYLLNLVYDVTPAKLVDMVVTEIGMIPCSSVPVVLRVKSTET